MGLSSKKQKDIPPELQPFHSVSEAEQFHDAQFATIPAFDNTVRDEKTGVGIPTDEAVDELKTWMNINKQ